MPDHAGPPPPTITFIVCTRNRASALPHALDSIAREAEFHANRVDLVIVDNGSTDATVAIVTSWAEAAPFPVQIVRQTSGGLAAARNAGMAAAAGTLLAFTDDDCALSPGYISDLLGHFGRDQAPVIRGGRVELGNPADLPFTIKTETRSARLQNGMHPGTLVLGCNMVIPRDVVAIVGLFDEWFGAGARFKAAEDADYIYRAHRAGIEIEYVPDMVVQHFHGRRDRRDVSRLGAGYFLGNGALYAKHCRNGRLIHHLRWDARKALAELFGGKRLDSALGLTYRAMVARNLLGMMLYWLMPGMRSRSR